jgi:hypothetical protein
MPIAGCSSCGRVEMVPDNREVRLGDFYKTCPECRRKMRWVRMVEAEALVRERYAGPTQALGPHRTA